LQEKIQELLEQIGSENEAEQKEYGERDLEELGVGNKRGGSGGMNSETLEKRIERLNECLAETM
jgi:hypothetical protein